MPANPLSALVLNTEAQAIPDTTLTGLSTYFEVYDPSDMHWAVNPSSMMPPRNGTYVVSATVTWAADADGWRSVKTRSPTGVISRVTGRPAGASVPTVQNGHRHRAPRLPARGDADGLAGERRRRPRRHHDRVRDGVRLNH